MFKEKANNEKKGEIETLEKKSESPGWQNSYNIIKAMSSNDLEVQNQK